MEGLVASIFVNLSARETAPDPDKTWLLWASVRFLHARDDGLSSSEEFETLKQIEDVLTDSVAESLDARFVGRVTTAGRRDFCFYSREFAGLEDAVARGMAKFPDYKWDSGTRQDSEWSAYLTTLYPTDRDWQRIKNRRVIEQLQKHGDSLEKERIVFHWAYFRDEDSQQQFVEQIESQGYRVTNQRKLEKPKDEFSYGVAFERTDCVDWNSINQVTLELFELAESLKGDYDGWETSVERPD